MAELDKPLEGAALYDKLYAGGYHNDLRLSHGLYLMYDLTEVAARSKHLQSVWWGARAMPGRSTSTTRPTNARDV